jgi:8-oxo-dGTP pyrophosphatase MutT (NUDIX family)
MNWFSEYISSIRKRLESGPPGEEFQLMMAPAHRLPARHYLEKGIEFRNASVTALIVPDKDNQQPSVLLVQRTVYAGVHSGQIALPGGKPEAGETLEETALRELFEETGILPDQVEVLGMLTPLYIPPSRFRVQPFVAAMDVLPELHAQEREIQALFTVPLDTFNPKLALTGKFETTEGLEIEALYFSFGNDIRIWGATAMILSELYALHQ